MKYIMYHERIQDFHFLGGGGGVRKRLCHERENGSPLRSGSRERLRALDALEGFWWSLVLSEPHL